MNEAHFQEIEYRLLSIINSASISIDIAMAWFTNGNLFSALKNALHRGVHIRLVLLDSPINFMEYAPDFNSFIKDGGQLYIATSAVGFMHHKFCIVDHKFLVSGSYNWTYYAETRNVENIIINDDSRIVQKYQLEFNRLINLIDVSMFAPRLTMAEIETYDDVDFRELNAEIENICHIQNRPIKRVFETKTQVIIKETARIPVSKWDIGIMTDKPQPSIFIKAGETLPCTSSFQTLYLDSITANSCCLNVAIIDPKNPCYNSILMEDDIMRVAKGTSNANLPIRFSVGLDDTGMLRIDVVCEESQQTMTLSKPSDKDLVAYE